MRQLHSIQLAILQKLLFTPGLRYSELRPDLVIENNQLDFHLDQLISFGYVAKNGKVYALTSVGKEYAGRLDTEKTLIAKQAKISAWVCCRRKHRGKVQLLIYTRLKQPFYGCQGFLSGKVKYGEKVTEAARRELLEETGLSGKSVIVSLKHFLVYHQGTKGLLEDKLMFLCLVRSPKGKLISENAEGRYEWVDKENLRKYLKNPFEKIDDFLGFITEAENYRGHVLVTEIDHYTEKF